jgi:hypothetical protein
MSDLYEQVEPSSKDDYEVLDQKDSVYEEEDEPISILSDKANVVGGCSLVVYPKAVILFTFQTCKKSISRSPCPSG